MGEVGEGQRGYSKGWRGGGGDSESDEGREGW